MRAEARRLRGLLAGFSGVVAIEIGGAGLDWLPSGHYADIVRVGCEPSAGAALARVEALPIATDAADLLVLAHVLERSPAPADVLAEAARILRADGRLVVVARRLPEALSEWPAAIMARRHIASCRRLRRRIEAAGLEWRGGADFTPRAVWRERSQACASLGYASHAAVAVKRVVGMNVIKPVWKERRARRSEVLQEHGQAN